MDGLKRRQLIGIKVVKSNISLVLHFICRLGTCRSSWVEKAVQSNGREYKSRETCSNNSTWNEEFAFDIDDFHDQMDESTNLELHFIIYSSNNSAIGTVKIPVTFEEQYHIYPITETKSTLHGNLTVKPYQA